MRIAILVLAAYLRKNAGDEKAPVAERLRQIADELERDTNDGRIQYPNLEHPRDGR